jgi:hypothetical protein
VEGSTSLAGALSPASPPGFVAVLTTAREGRDAPAEFFDERLPRQLRRIFAGVLALEILLFPYPVSLNDPAEPTGCAPSSLAAPPDLSAKIYAANCTPYRAKMEDPI